MNYRLIFFTPIFPPQYSGATFQAITLAKELKKRGDLISFLTLRHAKVRSKLPLFILEKFDGFDVIVVPINGLQEVIEGKCSIKNHISILFKLLVVLFLVRGRYSIIHCHILGFPFTGFGLIGRLLGKKTIGKVTMSNDLDFNKIGRLSGKLNKHFVFLFDCIIAISHEIYEILKDLGIPPNKISFIPNSVDTNHYCPVANSIKSNLKRKFNIETKFVSVFVGGITFRKGVDCLIKIWADFSKRYQDSTLLLIGPRSISEGALGDKYCTDFVIKYLEESGLEHRVNLVGRVDNVNEYLQMADLFVFPSTLEGMPNVVLEAMACGLPVVSFNVSGIADIITNKINGEVIEEGEPLHFRNAIELLYNDENLRVRYSENAVLSIQNRFSLQKIAEMYQNLYATL